VTDVPSADVITPEDEDIWLLCHGLFLPLKVCFSAVVAG
jgi:hypothetical protein